MRVEGKGLVAPGPIDVNVPDWILLILRDRAIEQAKFRDYGNRRDAWGQGLVQGSAKLSRAEGPQFIGSVGEWGVLDFLIRRLGRLVRMDLANRQAGDGGYDVELFGMKIQIKTRTSADSDVGLVRRRSSSGRVVELSAPVHLFCRYTRKTPNTVSLLGWQWSKDMLAYPVVPARRGDHMNIEVPDHDLLPMSRLVNELSQRKESNEWL